MVNPIDQLLKFIFDHVFYIVVIGFLGYFAYNYLKIKKKSFNIVDRSEVERLKFIERMRPNKVDGKLFLFRGKINLGKITHYKMFSVEKSQIKSKKNKEADPIPKKMINMVQLIVKPTFFIFSNPFSKAQCYQLNKKFLERYSNKIYLPDWLAIDKYFGIYYDLETLTTHHRVILKDNVTRTDLNEMASVYFVKSQEQSTFDPVHAHNMALKEKELEIELAKKKGMQETI